MNKFYYLLFFLISSFSFSQSHLFVESDSDVPLLVLDEASQISLEINIDSFNFIKEFNPCDFIIDLPFFNNESIKLYLESFNAYSNDFQLLRSTENGLVS
jgi:hypothetical protein